MFLEGWYWWLYSCIIFYFYMMNQATNREEIENCFPYFYVEQIYVGCAGGVLFYLVIHFICASALNLQLSKERGFLVWIGRFLASLWNLSTNTWCHVLSGLYGAKSSASSHIMYSIHCCGSNRSLTAKMVFYMFFKPQSNSSGLYVNNVTLRSNRRLTATWTAT